MNYRQAKKKIFHKTMPHGGWRKYKDAMKKAGFLLDKRGLKHEKIK